MKATAYHEAGHAVLDVRFAHRFEFVTIKPSGGASGYVQYGDDMVTIDPASYDHSDPVQHQTLESVVMSLFAGMVAECWAHGQDDSSKKIWKYAGDDLDTIDDLLEEIFTKDDATVYFHSLLQQTRQLLRRPANRMCVNVVAAALQRRWTLSSHDVKQIVEDTDTSLARVYVR